MTTAQTIIDDLIRREGDKYTNRPADRGGPTRFGIQLKTLRVFRDDPTLTAADVEALTEDEARAIYTALFIITPHFDLIEDPMLQGLLVDCAVQHGQDDAIEWLQRACGAKVDGDLGPKTAAAANSGPLRQIYGEIVALRLEHYGRLVTDDPKRVAAALAGFRLQAENAAGWNARAAEFVRNLAVL